MTFFDYCQFVYALGIIHKREVGAIQPEMYNKGIQRLASPLLDFLSKLKGIITQEGALSDVQRSNAAQNLAFGLEGLLNMGMINNSTPIVII